MKTRLLMVLMFLAVLLAGCGANEQSAAGGGATTSAPDRLSIKVGATSVPHAEILRFIKDNLAQPAGLEIEIVEFSDYVQPNLALKDRQIDANYFQHRPYMQSFGQEHSIAMVAVADVHIEPLGIYSRQVKALADVPEQAVVAIPNDPTNAGRALQLLQANGLLSLKEGAGTEATVRDITDNPKQLQIKELEAAQLPRSLDDVTLAVINGNYALQVGLTPARDALALETGKDNPYANVLAALQGRENEPALQALARLLNAPEVKQFIEEKYQGSVLPAF